jgi:hypothetical protein
VNSQLIAMAEERNTCIFKTIYCMSQTTKLCLLQRHLLYILLSKILMSINDTGLTYDRSINGMHQR